MTLFYFRFLLDVILSVLVAAFLTSDIIYFTFSEKMDSQLIVVIFYIPLLASNVAAVRSIVILFISVERVVASYFPIFFHNHRKFRFKVFIMILAVFYGLTEDIVLYVFCDFQLKLVPNCVAFGCTINACYHQYWITHRMTVFALMFLFSIFLASKLFMLRKSKNVGKNEQFRMNRLALIDIGNVTLFEFFPIFLANQLSKYFNFKSLGPYGISIKMLGCAVEAVLMLYILKGKKRRGSERSNSKIASGKTNCILVKSA
ncbi:Serpentine Receptor, class BC (Class B-like) [Caenorhabditis elegans]|nr:Serpentine Receptor, class BC (Class B-like) [Caenorhabditis elegans]CTQ86761.1 Serpentine Receptor, class BC (Class B-like) [Caenorhabditis elegans]|eukprot:NP_001300062.1 Serpentine Receptor, class BC (class B-like) [Caenorhabditis elegans]